MIGGRKRKVEDILSTAALIIVVIIAVAPVAWLLLTSFKNPVDVYAMPPKLVFNPTKDNYYTLFFERNFIHYLGMHDRRLCLLRCSVLVHPGKGSISRPE
jgi:ABC-type glycerol-3-phosphate transport system permease component